MKVRNVTIPKIGSYVPIGSGAERMTIKVAGREYDAAGHVYVIDDKGNKRRWA
jgi:hypothetical protein